MSGKVEERLICSVCGKDAQWNQPCIDLDLNVVCDKCSKTSTTLLYGISQHKRGLDGYEMDPWKIVWVKNGITLWGEVVGQGIQGRIKVYSNKFKYTCWTNGGQTAWPISESDLILINESPEMFLNYVKDVIDSRFFKCTNCGSFFHEKDVGGYPLFAGKVCKDCWTIHQERLEKERLAGHVCGNCGRPYGDCCC